MKNYQLLITVFVVSVLFTSCLTEKPSPKGTFGYDAAFLKKYQKVITLKENDGKSQLLVLPEYQGRVMTSTANGLKGISYGWTNYDLIASGEFEKHINVFGGEDRFWIGPEGGQYSIFFKKDTEFDFENWFTPKEIDTESFNVVASSDKEVDFNKSMSLTNYQGFVFDIEVKRKVKIFSEKEIQRELGIADLQGVDFVGYQSYNEIVNKGNKKWSKKTGLLSIWILGMYMPSPNTTVILPYKNELALNTSYFGTVPEGRLTKTNKHIMFKGDGTARFKLGLPPQNIAPFVGSYDADNNMLTIIGYTFNNETTYVNSVWRKTDNPYEGDVINSYNDGPLENGDQLGPFYELESSSHTEELEPNESIKHIHKTFHFEGDFEALNIISRKLLNKDLNELALSN